jgi:hypothetical protein
MKLMSQFHSQEILQQSRADGSRALGVELRTGDVAALHHRGEALAMLQLHASRATGAA